MEIFHCVFTSFYAIFICNNISNGIVYISWIALAVYDYMDFLNGNLLIDCKEFAERKKLKDTAVQGYIY